MRKALILLVVFAMVGAAAFAVDVKWTLGSWNGLAIVSVPGGTNIQAYDYSAVTSARERFGFSFTSADGNAGFTGRIQMEGPVPSATNGGVAALVPFTTAGFNQLGGWAKFFNGMVIVRGGILDDYNIATPIWNNYGNLDGKFGLYAEVNPIEGLSIGYFQPIPAAVDLIENAFGPASADPRYGHSVLGLAYSMKDIGKIELGAVLASGVTSATNGTTVYVGGNLSMIKGLTIQIEEAFMLHTSMDYNGLENISFNMGALTVGAFIGQSLAGATSTFNWGIEPTVSYKVSDNLSLNAIINIYSDKSLVWMSPILNNLWAGLTSGATAFGGGVSISWSASGATFTLGDYYAAGTNGGNAVYANVDVSL